MKLSAQMDDFANRWRFLQRIESQPQDSRPPWFEKINQTLVELSILTDKMQPHLQQACVDFSKEEANETADTDAKDNSHPTMQQCAKKVDNLSAFLSRTAEKPKVKRPEWHKQLTDKSNTFHKLYREIQSSIQTANREYAQNKVPAAPSPAPYTSDNA